MKVSAGASGKGSAVGITLTETQAIMRIATKTIRVPRTTQSQGLMAWA